MLMSINKICELCDQYYKVAIRKVQLDKGQFNSIRNNQDRIKYLNGQGFSLLGTGSSRIVYLINNQKVLKLALNIQGIAQNQVEFTNLRNSNRFGIFPKAYDKAPDDSWIEVEYIRIMSSMNEVAKKFGLNFAQFKDYTYILEDGEDSVRRRQEEHQKLVDYYLKDNLVPPRYDRELADELKKVLDNRELVNFMGKLKAAGILFSDLKYNHEQWGIGGDGRVVIADAGFTRQVYEKVYQDWDQPEDVVSETYEYSKEPDVIDPAASKIRSYRSKDPRNII
jgi:thiol-disulfide isomerase/thioredoxin